ncbi:MAG TPA: hypothetical protein VFE90_09015 [Myxococcales bacterium]|nr:hypothetical protein [Myxococcales bacterium]
MIALALALSLGLQQSRPLAQKQGASTAQPSRDQTAPQSDDIDLLPKAATPDAVTTARNQALEQDLRKRRQMLQLHQLGGMLTLATLGATVVFGELNYIDKYGGGGDTGRWSGWHTWSAYTSAAIFAATGALAVLAPSPIEKPARLDTAMLHKIAMSVATAGMVTQIVLGIATAGKQGQVSQRDYALAHQIVGFTTFGATAVGFGVLTF